MAEKKAPHLRVDREPQLKRTPGNNRQNFPRCFQCLAALLCLLQAMEISAVADTTSADYDYSTSGLGNKHRDDGFEWFKGFSDEANVARERSAGRATEAEKNATDLKSNANELKGMGDQVGEDKKSLFPRMQQAKLQDQRNSSGSSQLEKLMSTRYPENPNSKYAKVMKTFTIDNNRKLLERGDFAQDALYKKANEFNEAANTKFEQATQAQAVAAKLRDFQRIADTRNSAMGSVKQVGFAGNSAVLKKKNGARLSGPFDDGKARLLARGGSSLHAASKVTSSNEDALSRKASLIGNASDERGGLPGNGGGGLLGYAGGNTSTPGTGGKIENEATAMGWKDETLPEDFEAAKDRSKDFAALDAMFDAVAEKKTDPAVFGGAAGGGDGVAGAGAMGLAELAKETLEPAEVNENERTLTKQISFSSSGVVITGQLNKNFEDDIGLDVSLFQRVSESYVRIFKRGALGKR